LFALVIFAFESSFNLRPCQADSTPALAGKPLATKADSSIVRRPFKLQNAACEEVAN
jgi:hypothetical protein